MSKVQLQPAYVLHSRSFRETSLILEVFSREHGRIGVVARGARGAKSKWKSILQPFRPLLLSWLQRGDLATLTSADQIAAPPPLFGDALYCGLYLNELMMKLILRSDPFPEVFERYQSTLMALGDESQMQPALRLFERDLLEATGFALQLEYEHGGQIPVQQHSYYEYVPEKGPVRVSNSASSRSRVISGHVLLGLAQGDLKTADLAAAKQLMRHVIRHHLGDKSLSSDALRAAMRGNASNPLMSSEKEPDIKP